jgi:D-arabinose 1-dehydrogenase-like Zn-dependent alcohol dehydrogenase
MPPADLNRVFFLQLSINGSTMGSRSDLVELLELMERTKTRPVIDRVLPIQDARVAFELMLHGDVHGKLVLNI